MDFVALVDLKRSSLTQAGPIVTTSPGRNWSSAEGEDGDVERESVGNAVASEDAENEEEHDGAKP